MEKEICKDKGPTKETNMYGKRSTNEQETKRHMGWLQLVGSFNL